MNNINVVSLVKGSEKYAFVYRDDRYKDVLRTLGRFASNPELSFTWYDAAVLSKKVWDGQKQRDTPCES